MTEKLINKNQYLIFIVGFCDLWLIRQILPTGGPVSPTEADLIDTCGIPA
ncbi:Uncharacterized protein BN1183_AC_01530 [Pantoea ananatis]|nr:hypothetical protein PANA5342_4049 [Pantoea ananatis LMG 5342]CRH32209.1 Uncharacterized protein BN1183_AC_01530 [Pantoea ananatis]